MRASTFKSFLAICLLLCWSVSVRAATQVVSASGLTYTPSDITICVGDDINFAIGGSHNAVEVDLATWNANGTTSNGGFSLPFGGGTVTFNTVGTFYYVCTPHASAGMKGKVTVINPPSFLSGPATQSVCAGASVTLSTSLSGGGFSYQWKRNSINVPGATSSSLTISNLTTANAGTYTLTASSGTCSATSPSGVLTVTPRSAISVQPVNQSVCSGSSVVIQFTATGTSPSYILKQGTTTKATSTTNSFTLTNVTAADTGLYTVTVTSSCGPDVVSSSFRISLRAPATFVNQPITQSRCLTSSFSIPFSTTGAGPITAVLKQGTTTKATTTTSSFNISSFSVADTGSYTIEITGACAPTTTSNAFRLIGLTAPSITQNPGNKTVCEGQRAVFRAVGSAGTTSYVWKKGGTTTLNSTVDSLVFNPAASFDAGGYSVAAINNCGTGTPTTFQLFVTQAPFMMMHDTVCAGGSITFNGQVLDTTGDYTFNFPRGPLCDSVVMIHLYVRPVPTTLNLNVNACASEGYLFGGIRRFQSDTYRDTLTTVNGCDSIQTLVLTITSLTLSAVQNGPNLVGTSNGTTFQWLRNGQILTDSITLTIRPSVSGSYQLIGINGPCRDTTNAINVTVTGIDENTSGRLSVYPNPVQDQLTVTLPKLSAEAQLTIYDSRGVQVLGQHVAAGQTEALVQVGRLGAGIYRLQLASGSQRWQSPIVVQP
jgi:plastocyanin